MARSFPILSALAVAGAAAIVLVRYPAEPDPCGPLAEAEARSGPVPDTVALRHRAKREVAREAADGRRPLVEAAVLFRELNRLPPALPAFNGPRTSGRTEAERLCRQVIAYVDLAEDDWPQARADAALARLGAQLQEELGPAGGIRLPDPARLPTARELLDRARARMTDAERRALLSDGPGDQPEP